MAAAVSRSDARTFHEMLLCARASKTNVDRRSRLRAEQGTIHIDRMHQIARYPT
jgi:hypothetical protein